MKNKFWLFLSLGLLLFGCQENSHVEVWYGLAGVGYEYDIPANFEYCGNERDDEFNFTLYCYDDFREMGRCTSTPTGQKSYAECDYQASIEVSLESAVGVVNSDAIVEQTLQNRFPGQEISHLLIENDGVDFVVVQVESSESSNESAPIYLTVLPHGSDYFAIIIGQTSKSGEVSESWAAVELFVESYAPFDGVE